MNSDIWSPDLLGYGSIGYGVHVQASGDEGATSFGHATIASGDFGATAMGSATRAIGNYGATALGSNTSASGFSGATALGAETSATGNYGATALGSEAHASGDYGATALGNKTDAIGSYGATALGRLTLASGTEGATAIGAYTRASGDRGATALGYGTWATGNSCTALGIYNDTIVDAGTVVGDTSPLFIIGNGTSFSNRSNALVVRKDGHIGIGTNTPTAQLEVVRDSNGDTAQIHIVETSSNDFGRINFTNQGVNGKLWTVAARNKAVDSLATMNFYYGGVGNILSLKGNGNAVLMGNLTENSDISLKQNIVPVTNTLAPLMHLNAYSYTWKNRNDQLQIGLIAQEVAEVFPELVHSSDGVLSVNYTRFVPLLIEGMKEQQKEIKSLMQQERIRKNEIEVLSQKVDYLTKVLDEQLAFIQKMQNLLKEKLE